MNVDLHLMIAAPIRSTTTIPLIVALRELVTTEPTPPALLTRTLIFGIPVTMIVAMFNGLRES